MATDAPAERRGLAESATAFTARCRRFARISASARVDHVFSDKDTLGADYTIDDGHDNTATLFDPFSTDIAEFARASAEPGRNARFFADAAEHGAIWIFARGIFLPRRADSGIAGRGSAQFRGRSCRSARWWWAETRRRTRPRNWVWRAATTERTWTCIGIFSRSRIR